MFKKLLYLCTTVILALNIVGAQSIAVAKDKWLSAADYIELPYMNDNGKKIQLRGYKNFEIDWQKPLDAWRLKVDQDQILQVDAELTRAVSREDGRVLWERVYQDFDMMILKEWGQTEDGVIYTMRQDLSDEKLGTKVDLITRTGSEIASYIIPYKHFTFPFFIEAIDLDSNNNLITVTNEGIASFSPDGTLNWFNSDVSKWNASSRYDKSNVDKLFIDSKGNVLVLTNLYDNAYYLSSTGVIQWQKQLSSNDWSDSIFVKKTGQWIRIAVKPNVTIEILDLKSSRIIKVNNPTVQQLNEVLPKAGNGKYYVSSDGGIMQIDSKGKKLWEYKLRLNGYTTVWSMDSDAQGNVYIQDGGGNVFSLDPAGNERFVLIVKNKYPGSTFDLDDQGALYYMDSTVGLMVIKPIKG